jgi:3-oxoacyl-[acyl-carrier protein] reductase
MFNFKDKVAVVSGGRKGIGKSIVDILIKNECQVISTSRINKANDPAVQALDLSCQQSIANFIEYIHSLPKIDCFINNAGINIPESIWEMQQSSLASTLHVNLLGPAAILQAVADKMRIQKHGKIVNVASIAGVVAKKKASAYSSSKAGLLGLTRAIAMDMAEYGVLVNAVSPGPTLTSMVEELLSEQDCQKIVDNIPLKRMANPEEIARVVLFLCSDLNTYMTGQNIVVDGGFTVT